MTITFVLASASPARRKLLQTVGIEPLIYQSNFDEAAIDEENTLDLVQTLAQCKARTVAPQVCDALILGCDSVLEMDGEIYGKPENPEQAIARWRKMRGNKGTLYTGHALIDQRQQKQLIRCGVTQVYFADLSDAEIAAYVSSGEPLKWAGSFAIEGKGSLFVERIEGCHSNVIGLSLPLLRQMLKDLGYQVIDFWKK